MSSRKTFHSLEDLSGMLPPSEQKSDPVPAKKPGHDGRGARVRILLDTKGRKGKTVTLVTGLQHNPDTIGEIARTLKQHCGAGGTVRGRDIEIQGDQRERVAAKLADMNYRVS